MKKFVIAMIAVLAIPGLSAISTTTLAGSVPIGQLNMDAVPSIDQDGVRKVQTLLKERGFDPGPIDGVEGVRTNAAVRAFQERFGIKASGGIDNQTLFALGALDLAG
jgi:peptidoglycan hydrolase-like protein with peptidoglycan-binding domain